MYPCFFRRRLGSGLLVSLVSLVASSGFSKLIVSEFAKENVTVVVIGARGDLSYVIFL